MSLKPKGLMMANGYLVVIHIVKKIIQPISTVGSLAGIGIGNPVAAISSIMGSSVLGTISVDDKMSSNKASE